MAVETLSLPGKTALVTGSGKENGIGATKSLMEATPDQLREEFDVNAFGTVYLTQAVVSVGKMPKGDRIVNIGSNTSKQGPQGAVVYAATKAALDSLTASWAGEVRRPQV